MKEEVMTETNVEDFLAHYGVKGMRWGVTRSGASSGGGPSREQVRKAGLTAAKVAARYGAPPLAAAAATLASPVGLPSVAVLGLSAKILLDSDAQEAIRTAGAFAKDWSKDKGAEFSRYVKYGPDITNRVDKMTAKNPLPVRKEGGMFNPDADISGGRVNDVGTRTDQINSGWDKQFEKDKINLPW